MDLPSINLPVNGATLLQYLGEVNNYESSKAGEYIKAQMSGLLQKTIHSWFEMPVPELDRALTNKISNSVLAAGNAGLDRSIEALSQLRFEGVNPTSPKTANAAAIDLREVVRDYRRAKNWLFNQSKCVNSIVKTPQLFGNRNSDWKELAVRKVSDFEHWLKWSEDLCQLWEQNTKVAERLHESYKSNWGLFKGTFDSQLLNGQYRLTLQDQIDNVINFNDGWDAYIEQKMDQQEELIVNPQEFSGNYVLFISLEGNEVFFYIALKEQIASPKKLNSIKSSLVYRLSELVEKSSTKLVISEINSQFPTLCLRMKKPAKKNDFDAISESISNFCEEL